MYDIYKLTLTEASDKHTNVYQLITVSRGGATIERQRRMVSAHDDGALGLIFAP